MAAKKKVSAPAGTDADLTIESASADQAEQERPIIPKDVDLNTVVTVRNGFQGRLVYHSKRTNERWVWDSFNSEQEMELRELKDARNSAKAFFENNWFMFDEPWIIEYLGVRQYYRHSLRIDQFDEVFRATPAKIRKILSEIPEGQKKSVAYRAKELIASGEIDSRKTIATLEEILGEELIEH